MHDIAIIGAGPAGATLARLIGKRYKVLLVDKRALSKSDPDAGAAKCCGGLLAPDAQRMLSKFGLGLPLIVLEDPQLFVVKAIDLQSGLERCYQRHYINMNRGKFDKWLVSLIPDTIETRTSCRMTAYARENDSFRIHLRQDGNAFEEQARVLVAADGATSFNHGTTRTAGNIKRYIAIQEWVESTAQRPHFTSIFDTDITDFYCWTIPKGRELIIGAALHTDGTAKEKFSLLKKKLRQYGFVFGEARHREGAMILRPSGANKLLTAELGRAFIGEAGGWISPSSAEGLSYAFRSAYFLAEALRPGLTGFEQRYTASMKKLQRNILLKNLKSRVIFNPILRRAVMHLGLQAVRMVDE